MSEGQEFESLNRQGKVIAPSSQLAQMYVTSYMTLFHFITSEIFALLKKFHVLDAEI